MKGAAAAGPDGERYLWLSFQESGFESRRTGAPLTVLVSDGVIALRKSIVAYKFNAVSPSPFSLFF